MSTIFTVEDAFSEEKIRGAVTSVVSGLVANALNFYGSRGLGLSIEVSTLVFMHIVGNIIGYCADILFAKKRFKLRGSAEAPVPYRDIPARLAWLGRSFVGRQFYRYAVTVLIDTLVSLALLKWIIKVLDERRILMDLPFRNVAVAAAVAVFTFFLYTNILRFDWAYADHNSPMLNVTVLMWVSIVLMLYATSATRH